MQHSILLSSTSRVDNQNAGALSRQHQASVFAIDFVASGVPIPQSLQQVFNVNPVTQATQATISAFPCQDGVLFCPVCHPQGEEVLHVIKEPGPATAASRAWAFRR